MATTPNPASPRPLRVLFVGVVFGLLALGILQQRRRDDADRRLVLDQVGGERVELEPLELPLGELFLRGAVQTPAGAPAAGVQVFLFPSVAEPGRAEPLHLAFTDDGGRFELGELEPKAYGVVLSYASTPPRTLEIDLAAGVEDVLWTLREPLEPLEVLPEMRRADLRGRLQAEEARGSGGAVRPSPGVEGYEVVLRPAPGTHLLSGAVVLRTRTDAQGGFLFEQAVAEEYVLELLPGWAAGGSWPVLARLPLTHSPETDFFPVLRLRAGSVEGRVTDLRLRPIEGALVKLWPEDDPGRIWPPRATSPSGGFIVEDLPEGRYRLRLHAGAAVREASFEVHAGVRERLTFEPLDPKAPTE